MLYLSSNVIYFSSFRRGRFQEDGTYYDPLAEGITMADTPGFKSDDGNTTYERF